MSRVLLVSCNTATEPYPVPPLGMFVVAAGLVATGHEVRQFDWLAAGQNHTTLEAALAKHHPEYVGFSLRNIDNVDSLAGEEHWYLGQARDLVRFVRERCDAPLIVGGPALTIMPEAVRDFLGVDYCVSGAGEETLPELIADLEQGRSVPRLLHGPRIAPTLRPLVDREILEYYLRAGGVANLQTKRGCPFRCGYCTYPHLEGGAFRFRAAEEVAEEVVWMREAHGVQEIFFTDSVFNDPRGRWLEIAEALVRRGAPVRWSAFFRPQGLREEHAKLLARSGCMALELGTDAASDTVLEALNKGFDFAEVRRCDTALRDQDLPTAHFLMFGGPGETMESVEQGLANLAKLERSVIFAFTGIRIFPGAALEQRAREEGVLRSDAGDDLLRPTFYFSPQVDAETMNARLTRAFRGNRLRLFPPAEAQLRMDVMRRFGGKGLLWDKLLARG